MPLGPESKRRWPDPDFTGGLLAAAVSLLAFGAIAAQVIRQGALTRFDVTVMLRFDQHASALGTRLFSAITILGSPVTIALIGVCVAVVLLARRQRILLAGWIIALGGAGLLNEMLKALVHRVRPPDAALTLHHLSFSFPSGHAMGSMVGYGMLAYLLVLAGHTRAVRVTVIVLAAMLILLIGISRLYLGVHYFTDVLGGYAAGGAWLSACVIGTGLARRRATG